jgi:hypothetical protein
MLQEERKRPLSWAMAARKTGDRKVSHTRMISPEKEKTLRIGLTEIRLVKIII